MILLPVKVPPLMWVAFSLQRMTRSVARVIRILLMVYNGWLFMIWIFCNLEMYTLMVKSLLSNWMFHPTNIAIAARDQVRQSETPVSLSHFCISLRTVLVPAHIL